MSIIRVIQSTNRKLVKRLLIDTPPVRDTKTDEAVAAIVGDVRLRGDRAVRHWARKFDGNAGPYEVTRDEMERGERQIDRATFAAIRKAAQHIEKVAKAQIPRGLTVTVAPGVSVEQRVTPLDRVGCYVPGGRHPLPSSLLMSAIPAAVAGVRDIVVVCPRSDPTVMAAARVAGVTQMFRLGGAHAIAALAYGTRTIARVDRIVGPGNRYVAAAKALVAYDCGIDFYAGPSEIVVIGAHGRPDWIAADLIAQAEHDPDARAFFVTWNAALAQRVADRVEASAPRAGVARTALRRHGGIVVTKDRREAIELVNRAAPEHVVCENASIAREVRCAGSIFIGAWTAQVAGDYAIGSNHVLPTAGEARFRGGLSAADFVRVVTVQRLTAKGLRQLAPTVIALARAEGLEAHARSIEVRLRRSAKPAV